MKSCTVVALSCLAAIISPSLSFVVQPSVACRSRQALAMAEVELVAEPEGGEELSPESSMDGTRMKKMDLAEGVTSEDGTVYNFWLSSIAEGALIKEYKITMLKDAKSKAQFPGFRKGQIPPYAMPQITNFAIQEGLIKTIEQAVAAYGLKSLQGSDGEVEVLEDVQEMCKGYKDGESLKFTATFKAAMPESSAPAAEVIEAEVVTPAEEKLEAEVVKIEE